MHIESENIIVDCLVAVKNLIKQKTLEMKDKLNLAADTAVYRTKLLI